LLFADDLPFSSFITKGLQKAIDQVTRCCREWNLKCNLNRTKILVFKEGGKRKKDGSWTANDQKIKMADEINYLGVTFESSGGCKTQKLEPIAKRNRTLVAMTDS
jgi:hypothetical protein